jgi:hypothetical protein
MKVKECDWLVELLRFLNTQPRAVILRASLLANYFEMFLIYMCPAFTTTSGVRIAIPAQAYHHSFTTTLEYG